MRTEVGDRDPLVAVEDALREFPADEIVLAGRTDAETEAQRRRFGLPIARVDGAAETAGEKVGGTDAIARDVTRGRSSRTPVMLLAAVGAVVLAAMVLISLIALVVVWLV